MLFRSDPMTDPMTASGSELSALTAAELVAGYRSGDFTPLDATRSVLDTIEERDAAVNAFVRVDADGALAQATASTER